MYFSDIIICILPATPLYLLTYSFPFVRYVWRRTIEAGECFVIGRSFIPRWTLLGCVGNTYSFFSSVFLFLLFDYYSPSRIPSSSLQSASWYTTVQGTRQELEVLPSSQVLTRYYLRPYSSCQWYCFQTTIKEVAMAEIS